MLDFFRTSAQSWAIKILLSIIVLVFVFWGIGGFSSNDQKILAKVNDKELILVSQYQTAYENAYENLRQRLHERVDEFAKSFNLKRQVLDNMINETLMLQSANDQGFVVSDRELADYIFNNPAFQTDGRYDKNKYRQFLQRIRTPETEYEQNLRDSILLQKYTRFIKEGIPISQEQVNREYLRTEQASDILVLEILPNVLAENVRVDDNMIKEYYENHKTAFEQDTQINFAYFILNADNFKEKAKEKEIQRFYERGKNLGKFMEPEKSHVRHILFSIPSKAKANEEKAILEKANHVYQLLQKNRKSFGKLAKKYSEDPGSKDQEGDLGWMSKGNFVKEFEEAMEKLQPHEISNPIRTIFGYHIIEVLEKKPAANKSLEEARQEIEASIITKKKNRRLSIEIQQIKKKLESKVDITEIAKKYESNTITAANFDGRKNIEGIFSTKSLYRTLQQKKNGEKGTLPLGEDKGFVIFQVNKITPPFIKPFLAVKEEAKIAAVNQAKQAKSKQKIQELSTSIKTVQDLNKLAKQYKTTTNNITVKATDEQIPHIGYDPFFKKEVLSLNENKKVKAFSSGNRYYIVLFKKTILPDMKLALNLKSVQNTLRETKTSLILNSIIQETRKTSEVEYNKRMLDLLQISH